MYTRRAALTAGTVVAVSLAGCVDFVTGRGPLTAESEPAGISEAVLEETGYELDDRRLDRMAETVELAGVTREVEVTNWQSIYNRSIDLPVVGPLETAAFVVITTPAVEIAGRTLNPLAQFGPEELIDLIASEYEELEDAEPAGEDSWTMLGEPTDVARFVGETRVLGQSIDVIAHLGTGRSGDDFVIGLSIYPELAADAEADRAEALFGGIEHPIAP